MNKAGQREHFTFSSLLAPVSVCGNMSGVELLRQLVQQRLTAAAEDIVELFVKTMAQHEQLAHGSVKAAESRQHAADVQQVLANQPGPLEQQKWKSSLDDSYTSPPHIEEEKEGLWSSRDGQQLQGTGRFPLRVRVKTESPEEKGPDCSHSLKVGPAANLELPGCGWVEPIEQQEPRTTVKQEDPEAWPMRREHIAVKEKSAKFSQQPVRSEHDEAKAPVCLTPPELEEKPAGSRSPEQMETESGGEDPGGPAVVQQSASEKTSNSSESETEDSDDEWKKPNGTQSYSKLMKGSEAAGQLNPVRQDNTVDSSDAETEDSDCEQSKDSGVTNKPPPHLRLPPKQQHRAGSEAHSGRPTFCCPRCDKRFLHKANLRTHMRSHPADPADPASCSVRRKGASLRTPKTKDKEDKSPQKHLHGRKANVKPDKDPCYKWSQ
ncbi:uncharacterized protein PAE49_007457 [Odontesthes bonariensis]|uniref:uncharacterized protein LOC142384574 n=1 Tax=Odontesthes bonariensis TaxID=219752 RepID=UPI003F586710